LNRPSFKTNDGEEWMKKADFEDVGFSADSAN
jgi:hypothetical protein